MLNYCRIKQNVFQIMQAGRSEDGAAEVFATALSVLIILSVAIVFASTFALPPDAARILSKTESVISILFTFEYLLRLWTANLKYERPQWNFVTARIRYVVSFMAIVDLLAIVPFWIPYLLPSGMIGIRVLRLLRLVRVFKMTRQFKALAQLSEVIVEKGKDILVVVFFMTMMVLFLSLLLYAAEHDHLDKVTNAITALWSALGTFTKSGINEFHPVTGLGKVVTMIISVLGICLIAIPTGIITSGLTEKLRTDEHGTDADKHETDARDNTDQECRLKNFKN